MKQNPLKVTQGSNDPVRPSNTKRNTYEERAEATRAYYERLWKNTPEEFDPNRNAIERDRIAKTCKIIDLTLQHQNTRVADLGMGWGTLTRYLCERNLSVDAVDIASLALKHFGDVTGSRLYREALPQSSLPDNSYELVLCCELIAELHPHDQRLLISEIYRLLKPEGSAILTTALDIDSINPLEPLTALIETELRIEKISPSFHTYYLRLLRFLRIPAKKIRLRKDQVYYKQKLENQTRLGTAWIGLQRSLPFYAFFWTLNQIAFPLARRLEQSAFALRILNNICRTLSPEDGMSHVILVAKRKSLQDSAESHPTTLSRPVQRLRERIWE